MKHRTITYKHNMHSRLLSHCENLRMIITRMPLFNWSRLHVYHIIRVHLISQLIFQTHMYTLLYR